MVEAGPARYFEVAAPVQSSGRNPDEYKFFTIFEEKDMRMVGRLPLRRAALYLKGPMTRNQFGSMFDVIPKAKQFFSVEPEHEKDKAAAAMAHIQEMDEPVLLHAIDNRDWLWDNECKQVTDNKIREARNGYRLWLELSEKDRERLLPPLMLAEALERENLREGNEEEFNANGFLMQLLEKDELELGDFVVDPIQSFILQAWLRRASVLVKEEPDQMKSEIRRKLRDFLISFKPIPKHAHPVKEDKARRLKLVEGPLPTRDWDQEDEDFEQWRVSDAIERLYGGTAPGVSMEQSNLNLFERACPATSPNSPEGDATATTTTQECNRVKVWREHKLMAGFWKKELLDIVSEATVRSTTLEFWARAKELYAKGLNAPLSGDRALAHAHNQQHEEADKRLLQKSSMRRSAEAKESSLALSKKSR